MCFCCWRVTGGKDHFQLPVCVAHCFRRFVCDALCVNWVRFDRRLFVSSSRASEKFLSVEKCLQSDILIEKNNWNLWQFSGTAVEDEENYIAHFCSTSLYWANNVLLTFSLLLWFDSISPVLVAPSFPVCPRLTTSLAQLLLLLLLLLFHYSSRHQMVSIHHHSTPSCVQSSHPIFFLLMLVLSSATLRERVEHQTSPLKKAPHSPFSLVSPTLCTFWYLPPVRRLSLKAVWKMLRTSVTHYFA